MWQAMEVTPFVIGQNGPLNGQKWRLSTNTVIGRDRSCQILLPVRQVSRFHAEIFPSHGEIVLKDLNSKNGTYLNGKRISEPVPLFDGDRIQIALVQELIILSADVTVPLALDEHDMKFDTSNKLKLEKDSRRVWIGDSEVTPHLSVAQFRLLEILYEQEGSIVSRDELKKGIWGNEKSFTVSNQALDALIRRLRDRLSIADFSRNHLETVRGRGLRLDNPS